MVVCEEYKLVQIILAIITVCGKKGLKLKNLENEFLDYCGYPLPYKKFNEDLKSWILTLPDIYLVRDEYNEETLFQYSQKSCHIRELIYKQKSHEDKYPYKRSFDNKNQQRFFNKAIKYDRRGNYTTYPKDQEYNTNRSFVADENFLEFSKLECMLPLFYNHQAIGDDFFLDIADTKFGYYVPEQGPQACGLCSSDQTIRELTEKVKETKYLAPRVVVMIGLSDLLKNQNVNEMIVDLHSLISTLKNRNTVVTLVTLISIPHMEAFGTHLMTRMKIFNSAILDYACCPELQCNVIDMYGAFEEEQSKFQRNQDRLTKITRKDKYRVFSDFGRKIFINKLKLGLTEQLLAEH